MAGNLGLNSGLSYLITTVPKRGSHDHGFVIEFFVVVEDLGDTDHSWVLFGFKGLLISISYIPILLKKKIKIKFQRCWFAELFLFNRKKNITKILPTNGEIKVTPASQQAIA